MSLSTLLEAAKYLDYLDSNGQQQPQPNQQQQQPQQFRPHQTAKKTPRRHRSSRKDAAQTMVAMSLPTSTTPLQMRGVPIPSGSGDSQQATSLSSSFTTGSPLSSFASTALLCSKASGAASSSSSAASSLSSSDSSSSCGEILMGDNDFNQPTGDGRGTIRGPTKGSLNTFGLAHQHHDSGNQMGSLQQAMHQYSASSSGSGQSVARYIAATSSGPQLVTMTTSSVLANPSTHMDGSLRAGHVLHAHNHGAFMGTAGSVNVEARQFSLTPVEANAIHHRSIAARDGQAYSMPASSFGSEGHLSASPGSCPPLIMARVQPMILNSLSPSAQGVLAFQPTTSSSPTSSSSSYSRHRELHKTLEKNRRAHLRHCFELLKAELPASECVDKKTSHINIIKSAIRYVLMLRQQECEMDSEVQRLTKIKNELTDKLSSLRVCQQAQGQIEHLSTPNNQTNPQQATKQEQQQQQQPAAEQQLSFLLSQSKID